MVRSQEVMTEDQKLGIESAYPITPPLDDGGQVPAGYPYAEAGLTKREAFALAAMQGLVGQYAQGGTTFSQTVAKHAVEYADALLKELAK
jgi:hypothetical protein